MKRILSMFMASSMALSMMVTCAFASDFKDVPTSHVNYEAVETLETLNIIAGYNDDNYGSNDILTRAHLATIMTKAMFEDDIHYNATNVFNDVSINHWGRAYIDTAYRHGLMAGYGNGNFGPEDTLTYTQTARVILNAIGYGDLTWPTGVNTVAYELGLFDNIGLISFESGCTRAHAAQMIYNAFNLKLVNEYAGQHFVTNETFLKDILGFEKTTEYEDGHIYIAYKDLNSGKKKTVYVTNVRSTDEKVIYRADSNHYKFINTKNAKTYSIDWNKVDLFVNGEEVDTDKSSKWFDNDYSIIGIFNEKDRLIAIHVNTEGIDYIYDISFDTEIYDIVKRDKKWDKNTSTVTYFEESEDYIISNEVEYGWVTNAYKNSFNVNGMKISIKDIDNEMIVGDIKKDVFVKIFYNHKNEIAGIQVITNPYRYDLNDKTYHTVECEHVTENIDCDIRTFAELNPDKIYTFKECKECHANDGTMKITK